MKKLLTSLIHSLFIVLIICSVFNLILQILGVILASTALVNLGGNLFTYMYVLAAILGLACVGYSYIAKE